LELSGHSGHILGFDQAETMFRNLPFCESAVATIALPVQGFAKSSFD
jgi:hypothetical protein